VGSQSLTPALMLSPSNKTLDLEAKTKSGLSNAPFKNFDNAKTYNTKGSQDADKTLDSKKWRAIDNPTGPEAAKRKTETKTYETAGSQDAGKTFDGKKRPAIESNTGPKTLKQKVETDLTDKGLKTGTPKLDTKTTATNTTKKSARCRTYPGNC
jgi:hypothetical protein